MRLLLLAFLHLSAPALAEERRLPRPVAAIHDAESAADALAAVEALSERAYRRHEALVERALRQQALDHHQASRTQPSPTTLGEAEAFYQLYFARFPDSAHAYEMHYAFAELLYKLRKYDEAFAEYNHVVEIDPAGKRSLFCAHSAIFAAEEMMKREARSGGSPDSLEPLELSEWEARYLTALERFVRLYPDDERTRGMMYRAGYLLYNHDRFDEAEVWFAEVIARDPGSREAEQTVHLMLDVRALQEDWVGLRDAARRYLAQEGLGDERFQREVAEILARAEEKIAEEGQ